tara:strand:+ start:269 stop:403 length:135 start_codon:yes stop_codon:yes gene_type:complete
LELQTLKDKVFIIAIFGKTVLPLYRQDFCSPIIVATAMLVQLKK